MIRLELKFILFLGASLVWSVFHAQAQTIAVLPFDYITNDGSIPAEAMQREVQQECIQAFRKQVKSLNVQDAMTTNALLSRNGIESATLANFLPKEVAEMLGVDYVVYGSVNVASTGAVTYESANTTYQEKNVKSKEDGEAKNKTKGTATTSASSYTSTNYEAAVTMNIFDSSGQNIYSDTRRPLAADPNAFNGTLNNHVKHSPFGKKAKKK